MYILSPFCVNISAVLCHFYANSFIFVSLYIVWVYTSAYRQSLKSGVKIIFKMNNYTMMILFHKDRPPLLAGQAGYINIRGCFNMSFFRFVIHIGMKYRHIDHVRNFVSSLKGFRKTLMEWIVFFTYILPLLGTSIQTIRDN